MTHPPIVYPKFRPIPVEPLDNMPAPAARRTDPETSHQAAAQATEMAREHHERICAALKQHGPMGKDAIARATGLDGVAVARRLPELQRVGLAKPTGKRVPSDAGRLEREWQGA